MMNTIEELLQKIDELEIELKRLSDIEKKYIELKKIIKPDYPIFQFLLNDKEQTTKDAVLGFENRQTAIDILKNFVEFSKDPHPKYNGYPEDYIIIETIKIKIDPDKMEDYD